MTQSLNMELYWQLRNDIALSFLAKGSQSGETGQPALQAEAVAALMSVASLTVASSIARLPPTQARLALDTAVAAFRREVEAEAEAMAAHLLADRTAR